MSITSPLTHRTLHLDPDNVAEIAAFFGGLTATTSVVMIIQDGGSAGVVVHSVDADSTDFSLSNPEATGTVTQVIDSLTADADSTDFSISNPEAAGTVTQVPETITTNADPTAFSVSNPEATGTATTPVPLLVLADSDDTGLEVDAKALMVASAPGTAGNNFYADSDRSGTDTPLDGELGLGVDNTVISRFRRLSQTVLKPNR